MTESQGAPGANKLQQTETRGRGRPRGAKTGTGIKGRAQRAAGAKGRTDTRRSHARKSRSDGPERLPLSPSGVSGSASLPLPQATMTGAPSLGSLGRGGFVSDNFRFASAPWDGMEPWESYERRVGGYYNRAMAAHRDYVESSTRALTAAATVPLNAAGGAY